MHCIFTKTNHCLNAESKHVYEIIQQSNVALRGQRLLITLPPLWVQSVAISTSVCLSIHLSQKPHFQISLLTKSVFRHRSDKYSIARRDKRSNWFVAYDVLVASMNIDNLLTVTHTSYITPNNKW